MNRMWKAMIVGAFTALSITGCGIEEHHQSYEAVVHALPETTQAYLERSNDPTAIDKEFAKRLASVKKSAEKMVVQDNGTITVHHRLGTTVMPKEHTRIVVIRAEDPLIALDEPFIAASYNDKSYLYDELVARHVQLISINDETKTINYEQVQSLQPDLIIMRDSYGQGAYNALSSIAPTVAFNVNKSEETLLAIAYALGVPDKGEARLKAYYEKAKMTRIALADHMKGETTAVLRVLNKEIRLYPYLKNDLNRFMGDLLNIKPAQMALESELNPSNNAISLERLPDLDAGYLVVSAGYGSTSSNNSNIAMERLKDMEQDALWNNLKAVKENHVLVVDSSLWMAHGIIAKELAMQDLYNAWGK